ncbi:hypothetical protein N8J89_22915 [Crossiella sp. CA-258035]|uniref:hypothetical protein n=1 Tax=Crossiella sp. CA-258035 TaxID=2981138 RepID=UPI0024BD0ECC|nr:hypothetical protein [Crossiella sp. CA-258035]WHT15984.1 hypothetical protein N8J89_22915 [Crossiella sp. CA-258035]
MGSSRRAVLAATLGVTLLLSSAPAIAAPPDDVPTVAQVLDGVFHASDEELIKELEISCEQGEADERFCRMDRGEVHGLPRQLKRAAEEFTDLCRDLPECSQSGAQPRTRADIAKALRAITTASKNPAVRNLSSRAGEFADFAGRATTGGGALTANTDRLKEYARTALYLAASTVPPLGDLIGLAEAVAVGDVEQGITAVLGLAATAIGLAFPPAGAAIAAGVAIYGLAKFMWNYYQAKFRNWFTDPVGVFNRTFSSGADIKWTEHKVGDRTANVVFAKDKLVATQTLLLNSKWNEYPDGRKPATYTLPRSRHQIFQVANKLDYFEIVLIVWQDEKAHTAECGPIGQGHTVAFCKLLSSPVTISAERNAVLEVRYILKDPAVLDQKCPTRPCVLPVDAQDSLFYVENSSGIRMPVFAPYTVGIV